TSGSTTSREGFVLSDGYVSPGGVRVCVCQARFGRRRAVERPVAEHGEQDVATAAPEGEEGLVVTLPLVDLTGVVGSGGGVAKRGEGRQEHRALELLIPASRGVLASNGRTGPARDRRQTGVRGEVSSRGEGSTRHIGQESSRSPDS